MLRHIWVAFAGFAMLVGFTASAQAQVDTASLLNKPAANFSLSTVDGKPVKLSDEKGKVVVLEFWRLSNDKTIPSLLPFVQRISEDKKLTDQGVVVWAITAPAGQTKDQVAQFMKEKNYSFTVPWDGDFKVFKQYLNRTLPATVVVGKDGNVIFANPGWDQDHAGHIDRLILNAIDQGLHGFNGSPHDLVGEPTPAITITTFDGKKIKLDDLKGKVVLLDVWASWCPHCALELPWLETVFNDPEWAKKGLVIVTLAANLDEKADEAKAFYDKHKFTFPAGFDTDSKAGDKLGLLGVPSLYLIGRDGTVHNFFAGFDTASGGDISKDILRAAEEALSEPAPAAK